MYCIGMEELSHRTLGVNPTWFGWYVTIIPFERKRYSSAGGWGSSSIHSHQPSSPRLWIKNKIKSKLISPVNR
jgi:hypothetical protein